VDSRRGRPHHAERSEPEDPAHGLEHAERRARTRCSTASRSGDGLHGYFVHSYHLNTSDKACLVADADYGGAVTAMVARDNYVGTQFHPEKSQRLGLALIANFLKWKP
jgi:glutamine amidotransferase